MANRDEAFYQRLTRLFRTGPAIRRKIKGQDPKAYYDKSIIQNNLGYYGASAFKREASPFSVMGAYGLLDRMSRYAEFCFSPETLIYTTQGVYSIKELAEKWPNGEIFNVWSYDHNKQEIVIASAHHPRITKDGLLQKLVKITFDDGGFIKTTLDHKFLLRDGSYIEAQELKENDALMPFYMRKITGNYHQIYMAKNNRAKDDCGWEPEHNLIAEAILGRKLNDTEVVHHIDFNPENNNPTNLKIMSIEEHKRYHAKLNNKNKFNKKNQKHSNWMKQNNPVQRTDITFAKIFDTANAVNFSLRKTSELLKADINVLKRRLREVGFENWQDFSNNKGILTTIRNASKIITEMQEPSLDDLISIAPTCKTIYEAASKLNCTENTIRRFLKRKNKTWSEIKGKLFSPGENSLNSEFDFSISYQDICSVVQKTDTKETLAKKLNTTPNKIVTRLEREGFHSFSDWLENHENHKVAKIEFLQEESQVYNITVDSHHNLAVGSLNSSQSANERPFSMVICRQSEMEYCLHPETPIAVPGGYKTIKQLADEYGTDKEFIVYSYDHNQKKIVPALAKQARITRTDHAYKVIFDNGKEIIGSANHRLMTRDGTYCEIQDLKPGMAMMPFYRKSFYSTNKTHKEETGEYLSIYTMDKLKTKNGWMSEHRLIAEWAYRPLNENEVVHHIDFCRSNNDPSNLKIMTDYEYKKYHTEILNGEKWNHTKNAEWISSFKEINSVWMKENNPAERRDITFPKILQFCQENDFNLYKVCSAFDTDPNVIKRKLKKNGFDNFITFAQAYDKNWKPGINCNNSGENNGRFNSEITFNSICNHYHKGISCKTLAKKLNVSITRIVNCLKENGYESWSNFTETYNNLKVSSVEYYGILPLYDLTVDGYKNFATDSVISHNTAEIATALDIYADESCANDENGRCLHIFSDNAEIRKALEELFYETANVELDMRRWMRNLVKYGDFFLYNEVIPDQGVVAVEPIPVNVVEREEMFDPEDPYAVRFKLLTHGGKVLENWQVTHFRIQGNELFHPYGTSFLEPVRRTWRQLIMMEDAMLVYRIVRSPERRVFYIDVSGVHPNDIPTFMEAVKETIKGKDIIDRMNGRMDIRYNPVDVNEDYFLPARPNSQTKIDTLAGGQHVSATEDVEYIQKKLIAGLKVPRAYLTFDENLSCLTGETEIPLLNGTSITIKELSEKFNSGEIKEEWCFASKENGTIVPGKITKAWMTKKVKSLYNIQLDNGEIIRCTENHPFMMRDGTYKRADELKENDSLMPFYVKHSSKINGDSLDGYQMLFDNFSGSWEYTHKIVNNEMAKLNGGHIVKKQRVIHHKDFNKLNNSPENLQEMSWYSHRKLHSENLSTTLLRPDVIAKREPLRLAALASNKHREQKSRQMKIQMSDRNSSIRSWIHGEEIKKNVSKNMKKNWENKKYRDLKTKQNKEILTRPEVREKIFGKNHWATKMKNQYNLSWLINFCKENNITKQNYFKYSAKHNAPIGMRTLNHIFKTNNIKGWKHFVKQFLHFNHKISKIIIERCNDPVCVYDLEVEKHHNFAVKQGVFVHNSKATLAQEDIRFSRTIATLQKIIISELSKLAIIHLFAKGFEGEDLLDFELRLSNPSTIAVQQKLQLLSMRLDAASKAQEMASESTILSEEYIQTEILGLRMDQILNIRKQRFEEQLRKLELTKMTLPIEKIEQKTTTDPFDPSNYTMIAGKKVVSNEIEGEKSQEQSISSIKPPEPGKATVKIQTSVSDKAPIKANPTPNLDAAARKNSRRLGHTGSRALSMPDFKKMLDVDNRYAKDPFDSAFLKNPILEYNQTRTKPRLLPNVPKDIISSLKRFEEHFGKNNQVLDLDFIVEGEESNIDLKEIEQELDKNRK